MMKNEYFTTVFGFQLLVLPEPVDGHLLERANFQLPFEIYTLIGTIHFFIVAG